MKLSNLLIPRRSSVIITETQDDLPSLEPANISDEDLLIIIPRQIAALDKMETRFAAQFNTFMGIPFVHNSWKADRVLRDFPNTTVGIFYEDPATGKTKTYAAIDDVPAAQPVIKWMQKNIQRYMNIDNHRKKLQTRLTYIKTKQNKRQREENNQTFGDELANRQYSVSSNDPKFDPNKQLEYFRTSAHFSIPNPMTHGSDPKFAGLLKDYNWENVPSDVKQDVFNLDKMLRDNGHKGFEEVYAATFKSGSGKPRAQIVLVGADGNVYWRSDTDELYIVGYNKKTYKKASRMPFWDFEGANEARRHVMMVIGRYPFNPKPENQP